MEQTKSNIALANVRGLDLKDLFDSSQVSSSRRRIVALGGSALLSAGIGHWASVGPALAQTRPPVTATLGQRIVAYATSHVGQCVADTNGTIRPAVCGPPPGIGPGECTHLAHSAPVAAP